MTEYVTSDGDMVDLIAWKYYGTQDGSLTEQILEANPGLADQGPILPAGITIALPDIPKAQQAAGVRLWG